MSPQINIFSAFKTMLLNSSEVLLPAMALFLRLGLLPLKEVFKKHLRFTTKLRLLSDI